MKVCNDDIKKIPKYMFIWPEKILINCCESGLGWFE